MLFEQSCDDVVIDVVVMDCDDVSDDARDRHNESQHHNTDIPVHRHIAHHTSRVISSPVNQTMSSKLLFCNDIIREAIFLLPFLDETSTVLDLASCVFLCL